MAVADGYSASAAREVLERCKYFLRELRDNPTGIAWDAKFSAAVALLRSVGYVLKDVDAADENTPLGKANKKWWDGMKCKQANRSQGPNIFWDFIDKDRHLIIHKWQLRAGQSMSTSIPGVGASAVASGEAAPSPPLPQKPQSTASYHMNSGPFCGCDPHDLVEEAIRWWQNELKAIEAEAAKAASAVP